MDTILCEHCRVRMSSPLCDRVDQSVHRCPSCNQIIHISGHVGYSSKSQKRRVELQKEGR
jgi:hypothetical protein